MILSIRKQLSSIKIQGPIETDFDGCKQALFRMFAVAWPGGPVASQTLTCLILLYFRFLNTALSLTEAGSSVTFDPLANAEEHTGANYKLHVRQILLDHTAKEGEYNVVQVWITTTLNNNS